MVGKEEDEERRRRRRSSKEWHLEGNKPDGPEPLLAAAGGQDVAAGEGGQVEGCAVSRTRLPRGCGSTDAVLEAHHGLLQLLHRCPLPGGGGLIQHGVQLQSADPRERGSEEHHPHFPPRLLLHKPRETDKAGGISAFR